MKVATVDIGTNSMRLMIADYVDHDIKNRKKYIKITKMGKGIDKNKVISDESIKINADALEEFVNMARKEKCEKIKVIGTSALRDSVNKKQFLDEALRRTGINVEIISGDKEASLGFFGIRNLLSENDYTLTIDIGGGSTEFVLGNSAGELVFSKSENVGCVRLTERILKNDPPTKQQLILLDNTIDDIIKDTIDILNTYKISKFIGIGGTATSISAMIQKLEPYSSEKVHNSKIYYDDLQNVYDFLKTKTLNEKKMITGLHPQRADVILTGTAILKSIMKHLNAKQLVVSEYDNLEGIVYLME